MTRRERASLLGALLVCASLGAVVAARWEVTTDITAFLPEQHDRRTLQLSRLLADSELSRTMVLTLGGPDAATARQGGVEFEAALLAQPGMKQALAYLQGGPPQGLERAMYELYHPRRLGFLAASPEAARARLTEPALREAAVALRAQLAQPMSPLLNRLAPSDPLLVLPSLFERLQGSQGAELSVEDGRFMTRDGRFAVLFLATRAAAFDPRAQAPVLAAIQAAFRHVNAAHADTLVLDQSGINRFAVRSERAIKADIQRVSTLSVLGLAGLLFGLFRSARLLGLSAIPLGAGVLSGCAACLIAFGRIHGITLAFGASLLGVALDYVVHLYCHHAEAGEQGDAHASLRGIRAALLTGAATTLVGFSALGGAGFTGLSEVALFASAGITGALAATFFVLPSLMPARIAPVRARTRLVDSLTHMLAALRAHRRVLWLLPALACALAAVGLPRLHMSTDFLQMERLDPALVAEDERVRARVARLDGLRFVVAAAEDEDQALRVNTRIAERLDGAVQDAALAGYRSVAGLLPAPSVQAAVAASVQQDTQLAARLTHAFEAEGFVPGAVEPFLKTLRAPAPAPVTFQQLRDSPLAPLVRPFRLALPGGAAFVTFLHGVQDPEAVRAAISDIAGAHFIEQGEQLRETQALYQTRTLQLLGVGLVAVLLILALRYRDLRKTLAAFLPSVLAATVTVSVLALSGHGLDLVVLTALLMVVSMGVDYGVFLVDADAHPGHRSAALLSVVVAALSTVLGFGLLALSEHPLLFSIGLTAMVGMLACLVLAPTSLVLLTRRVPAEQVEPQP